MPDLNGTPSSPRLTSATRQTTSRQMSPPSGVAAPSLNILPSNQDTVNNNNPSTNATSPPITTSMQDMPTGETAVSGGPGPLRHPRPLTAAELHIEFEKEQEAVVNRLTRELDMLRSAQNASVVSNASSTSASASGSDFQGHVDSRQHLLSSSGFSIPSAEGRRHQRSSSIQSNRSLAGSVPSIAPGSASVIEMTAPAPIRPSGVTLSRQDSIQSHLSRHSRTGSPLPFASGSLSQSYSHLQFGDPSPGYGFSSRYQQASLSSTVATPGSQAELSPGLMPTTSRFEETAYYRHQLDSVTRENDGLKRRIRELERMVRERRASDASRPRSESVSTTASISVAASGAPAAGTGIARPRDGRDRVISVMSQSGSVGVGVPEEEVKFGESAFTPAIKRDAVEGHAQGTSNMAGRTERPPAA